MVDMPRVLMHFDHYNSLWWVGFLEADCRTSIGPKTRYPHRRDFRTLKSMSAIAFMKDWAWSGTNQWRRGG